MKNIMLEAVYIFNDTEGITELRVLADSIEQRNGWVIALWHDKIMASAKEECLKAFYLSAMY